MARASDLEKLVAKTIRKLGGTEANLTANLAAGRAMKRLTRRGFQYGRDPEGQRWQPNQAGTKTLVQSGALRDSVTFVFDSRSVKLEVLSPYAPTHQKGAVIRPRNAKALHFKGPGGRFVFARKVVIPKRPIVPEGALPPKWQKEVERDVANALTRRLAR